MRRKKAKKRNIEPDVTYNNVLVSKLINYVMREGKKTVAEDVVYDAFAIVREKTKKDPSEILTLALQNVSPFMEVKSRRVGGATYQVPYEVRGERKVSLAFRWIVNAAKSKKGKPMREKLAQELIDAAGGSGDAVRKKENVHRMAEANKAFAHFSW